VGGQRTVHSNRVSTDQQSAGISRDISVPSRGRGAPGNAKPRYPAAYPFASRKKYQGKTAGLSYDLMFVVESNHRSRLSFESPFYQRLSTKYALGGTESPDSYAFPNIPALRTQPFRMIQTTSRAAYSSRPAGRVGYRKIFNESNSDESNVTLLPLSPLDLVSFART